MRRAPLPIQVCKTINQAGVSNFSSAHLRPECFWMHVNSQWHWVISLHNSRGVHWLSCSALLPAAALQPMHGRQALAVLAGLLLAAGVHQAAAFKENEFKVSTP
jgi:hypothetical protein